MSETKTKPKFCWADRRYSRLPGSAGRFRSVALEFVHRHVRGDWGEELCEEDRRLNDESSLRREPHPFGLPNQGRREIWIISEATNDMGHRAATTLLLPDEY